MTINLEESINVTDISLGTTKMSDGRLDHFFVAISETLTDRERSWTADNEIEKAASILVKWWCAEKDLFILEKGKERQEKNTVFCNKYFATLRFCTIGHTWGPMGEVEVLHDFEIIVRVQGEHYGQIEVDRHWWEHASYLPDRPLSCARHRTDWIHRFQTSVSEADSME